MVELTDRIYADVDGAGGYVYTRLVGGVEESLTEDEVAVHAAEWRFFYTPEALEQLKRSLT